MSEKHHAKDAVLVSPSLRALYSRGRYMSREQLKTHWLPVGFFSRPPPAKAMAPAKPKKVPVHLRPILARVAAAGGRIPPALAKSKTSSGRLWRETIKDAWRQTIIIECDRTCQYCLREGDRMRDPDKRAWHIDHIVPVSKGGLDALDNLTLACKRCNLRKGSTIPYRSASPHTVSAQDVERYMAG